MSRAIPSDYNEYLLDQSTRYTGIICDGGIMPLRTNTDPTSLWYKNCLRGEDPLFLQEAILARRNASTNSGITKDILGSRMSLIKTQIGLEISSGLWTDVDPTSGIGFHSFGQSYPTNSDIISYVKSCLNPISQFGAGDVFQTLDSGPVINLFKGIKSLNYLAIINQAGYRYSGFSQTYTLTTERVQVTGHTDGTSTTTTTNPTLSRLWYSYDSEAYNHSRGYPNGLLSSDKYTPQTTELEFAEVSTYRNYHRYFAMRPFGVFEVRNEYSASWQWNGGAAGSDSYNDYVWILAPLPVTTYVDLLTATTITIDDQHSWLQWFSDVFTFAGLEMYSTDVSGAYQVTDYAHSRTRTAIISGPLWVFWIGHFLYCNLEGVSVQ